MPTIRFAHNWNNKLDCEIFTTIRKFTPEKFDYYLGCVGKEFTVILKNKSYGKAKLLGVTVDVLDDIPELTLLMDTGMEKQDDILKLFKKFGVERTDKCILLLFKNTTLPVGVLLDA